MANDLYNTLNPLLFFSTLESMIEVEMQYFYIKKVRQYLQSRGTNKIFFNVLLIFIFFRNP